MRLARIRRVKERRPSAAGNIEVTFRHLMWDRKVLLGKEKYIWQVLMMLEFTSLILKMLCDLCWTFHKDVTLGLFLF